MPALGLVLTWGGYWFLAYGLALRKNANVTLVDMALPSHRNKVVSELSKAWHSAPTGSGGKSGAGGVTVPLVPVIPPFGPSIKIPGTNIKVGL